MSEILPRVCSIGGLVRRRSAVLHVKGAWKGRSGKTVVELTNGSVWQQAEYVYEYLYAYRPEVVIDGNEMHVEGMSRTVRVRRLR